MVDFPIFHYIISKLYVRLNLKPNIISGMPNFAYMAFASLPFALTIGTTSKSYAEQTIGCNEITAEMGYRIRNVVVRGSWISKDVRDEVNKILQVGSIFEPQKAQQANNVITEYLAKGDPSNTRTRQLLVETLSQSTCPVGPPNEKSVDITFTPYQLLLTSSDSNPLGVVPRIRTPGISIGSPSFLERYNTTFSILNDAGYGTSGAIAISSYLTDQKAGNQPVNTERNKLGMDLFARRAFVNNYYNYKVGIDYSQVGISSGRGLWIEANYGNKREPVLDSSIWVEEASVGGGLKMRWKDGIIRRMKGGLSGGYSGSATEATVIINEKNTSSQGLLRGFILADLRTFENVQDGSTRIAGWAETTVASQDQGFQRMAATVGHMQHFGTGYNTLDFELVGSAGIAFGNPPQAKRFYVGSDTSNIFSLSPITQDNIDFPVGPMFRGLGQSQGGVNYLNGREIGGTSYASVNLSIGIPIKSWSKPLIPEDAEVIKDDDEDPIPLNEYLVTESEKQFNSALRIAKARGDITEAEVTESRITFPQEVVPVVNYLATKATLYSIKPVIYADYALLSSRVSGSSATSYFGIGGGVRASILNADLEVGYMHTISPVKSSGEGNVFLRFLLRELF
jgi:hypothetical protein